MPGKTSYAARILLCVAIVTSIAACGKEHREAGTQNGGGPEVLVTPTPDPDTLYVRLDGTNDPASGQLDVETEDPVGLSVADGAQVGVVGRGEFAGVEGLSSAAGGVGVAGGSIGDNAVAFMGFTNANKAADSTNYEILHLESMPGEGSNVKTVVRQSRATATGSEAVVETTIDKFAVPTNTICGIEIRASVRQQGGAGKAVFVVASGACERGASGDAIPDTPTIEVFSGSGKADLKDGAFLEIDKDGANATIIGRAKSAQNVVWHCTVIVHYLSN